MKNGIYVLAVGMLILAGGAAVAYQGNQDRGAFHEQMEEIVESGDYAALEALREETGRPLARMIENQEDLDAMQIRHAEMVALYGEGPHFGMNQGMGKHMNRGIGGLRGCQ